MYLDPKYHKKPKQRDNSERKVRDSSDSSKLPLAKKLKTTSQDKDKKEVKGAKQDKQEDKVKEVKQKEDKSEKIKQKALEALREKLEAHKAYEAQDDSQASDSESSSQSLGEEVQSLIDAKNRSKGNSEVKEDTDEENNDEEEEDGGDDEDDDDDDDEASPEGEVEEEESPSEEQEDEEASEAEDKDKDEENPGRPEDKEKDFKGADQMQLVPVSKNQVRNSTTNKREWDSFCRAIQNKKTFPCELSSYVAKNKTDLFGHWLDSNRSWDECKLRVERVHQASQESLNGWIAKAGKDLVKEYGEEKGKTLMAKRFGQGLYYNHEDFPDDELERFYYMKKPKEMNRRQTTTDSARLTGDAQLNDDMLRALTDESEGMMRAGALPEGMAGNANGLKMLHEGLVEAVQAAPKKKAKKEGESSEPAAPKTPVQQAKDLMQEILDESVAARRKSMALGSVNYAGELSTQLLDYAQKMEKRYKSLQKAVTENVVDESFYRTCFKKIETERKWYKTAEVGGFQQM